MDWWTFNPSCCVGFSRPAAFNTPWSLGSGRRTSQLHMQRVDTVGVLKTEGGNQRREKKRWMEADVSKGNSHAEKPSQLQNKLHVKVNELLRQLQQGDQQLKDLWKVNDSLTEEIALKKKTLKKKSQKPARQWAGFLQSGKAWQEEPQSPPREKFGEKLADKRRGRGKTHWKETNEEKERQRRMMQPNLWSKQSSRNLHQLTEKKGKWIQRGLKKEKEAKKKRLTWEWRTKGTEAGSGQRSKRGEGKVIASCGGTKEEVEENEIKSFLYVSSD